MVMAVDLISIRLSKTPSGCGFPSVSRHASRWVRAGRPVLGGVKLPQVRYFQEWMGNDGS